jgi:hypothetical protein
VEDGVAQVVDTLSVSADGFIETPERDLGRVCNYGEPRRHFHGHSAAHGGPAAGISHGARMAP